MTFYQVQAPRFRLAGSGILSSDTTIKLQSFALVDDTLLTMADFGSIGFATLEPGTSREEQISFEGVTQNDDGTATLTTVTRGLDFTEPYAENNDLKLAHAGSTTLVISNTAKFYTKFMVDSNEETITGKHSFATIPDVTDAETVVPAEDADLTTKKHVDDTFIRLDDIDTDVDLTANSDTKVPSQKAIRTYAVTKIDENESIDGVKTFVKKPIVPDTISSDEDRAANVKYVNDTASFGAPDASPTVKGIAKITTTAESATEPIAVSDTDPSMNATRYLLARAQDTPDLTLKVSPANVYFGNTLIEFAGGNSPSFTAPTTNPRIDLLYLDKVGVLQRLEGEEAVEPQMPGFLTSYFFEDLLAYYEFEDNANDSEGPYNATVEGATFTEEGKIGKALELDGTDDYVQLPTIPFRPGVSTTNEFSVSCWIKRDTIGSLHGILNYGNDNRNNSVLIQVKDNNKIQFYTDDDTNSYDLNLEGTTNIGTDWHFIVCTFKIDSGVGYSKIYLDGELEAEGSKSNPSDMTGSTHRWIGCIVSTPGSSRVNFFDGKIDEFSIYDRALTAEEISNNYNDGLGVPYGVEGKTIILSQLKEVPLICSVYNRVGQSSIKDTDDSTNGYIQKDLRPIIRF